MNESQQAKFQERMQQIQGQMLGFEMEMRIKALTLAKEIMDRAGALEEPDKVIDFADKLMKYIRTGIVIEAPKPVDETLFPVVEKPQA